MVDAPAIVIAAERALRAERDKLALQALAALLCVPLATGFIVFLPLGSAVGHHHDWDVVDLALCTAFALASIVLGVRAARGGAALAARCAGRRRMVVQARLACMAGVAAIVLVSVVAAAVGGYAIYRIGRLA